MFRPALTHARPAIPGFQPARVLGAAGEPAQLDDHGRVKVRLWPTAQTDADQDSGLWLPMVVTTPDGRVDPSRVPLAGSEVLVSFLDSDPDRPVLYATASQPPTPRPAPQTRCDDRLLLDWLIRPMDT